MESDILVLCVKVRSRGHLKSCKCAQNSPLLQHERFDRRSLPIGTSEMKVIRPRILHTLKCREALPLTASNLVVPQSLLDQQS
jgi:hypothetical protein